MPDLPLEQSDRPEQAEQPEQPPKPGLDRRSVLAAAAAGLTGVGAAALAACSTSAPVTGGGGNAGTDLVATSAVPVGGAVVSTAAGQPVVVAQPTAGNYVGHSGICTHAGCTVAVASGLTLQCPCHGSVFDAATGQVQQGPAVDPLPSVAVQVSGGQVVTG